ncbi:MAG: ComEC/Rec2 family competence protein [Patescibacteria group bacterium]
MSAKLYKILLISGIVLALLAIPIFGLTYSSSKNLEVDFLDVGQGDAILIKSPFGQNILVDGGPDGKVVEQLGKKLPFWDKQIDLIVLTHPHDDHVTGLTEIIKRYDVRKILYTGVVHDAPNYLAWLEEARNKKIPLALVDRPQVIKLGENCELDVLFPQKSFIGQGIENLNNSSIVAKLFYGQTSFLLTGDAEIAVEKDLLAASVDLKSQVLKIGHHGSDTSSSEEFLEAVKPKFAVIEVGKDNDFGHPNLRILKRLERIGAEIFRTDLDGTIKFESDGMEINKKY